MGFRNFSNFMLSYGLIFFFLMITPKAYDIFAAFSVAVVVMKLAEWLMATTRKYFLHKNVSPKNKAVLITGCDSGFGLMLSKRMDKLGYQVFAGCLFPTGEGAKELVESCSSNLKVVPLDVTNDQSIREARDFVAKNLENDVLWAIVNNAGIAHAGEVEWAPIEDFQKVYAVNAEGMVKVTKEFMSFIKKSKGRVVNNTSFCGLCSFPGYVGYCMSKAAAVSFTSGLRVEMLKWGVKCSSIEAFFYKTQLSAAQTVCDMVDHAWQKADPKIREEYGEAYLEGYKDTCRALVGRSSSKVHEVVDCLEDAVTAEDPLSVYFPCYFLDKIGLKILQVLPIDVREAYQRTYLKGDSKVAALQKKKTARDKVISRGMRYIGPVRNETDNGIRKIQ